MRWELCATWWRPLEVDATEHAILRAAEDQHWWYRTLHRQVLGALAGLQASAHVLDAGCGTGGMLSQLRGFESYGVDLSAAAVEYCRQRGLPRIVPASTHELPFGDQVFDAVLSLDVLYHEDVDEHRTLAEMTRVLKPGGLLVLNLPAFECLRGTHDIAVKGVRRYRSQDLPALLSPHGLRIERSHYWNAWLFLPLLLWRSWTRHCRADSEPRSDVAVPVNGINQLMARLAGMDAAFCQKWRVPFGSSLFVTAHRMVTDGEQHTERVA